MVVVEHRKFICVCFDDTNNNKVWQYTLYDDETALTEWGRVGKKLQSKITTESKALSKMREKTRSGNKPDKFYTEVKVAESSQAASNGKVINSFNLKSIVQKQIVIKDPILKELVDFLVEENVHQIIEMSKGSIEYDTSTAQFKTPLGVITPDQVSIARKLLNNIADLVVVQDYDNKKFGEWLNGYLRLIPHSIGMSKITPELIFPDDTALQFENNLLDGLEASFNDIQTNGANTDTEEEEQEKQEEPKIFDVSLELIKNKKVINKVLKLYKQTKNSMHVSSNFKLKDVYSVKIATMNNAFEKVGRPLNNIMELWHGTKCSNLLSIFKKGLIIPSSSSSHVTGRMFGNGLYFSDQSTKALNYATGFWGNGGSTNRTFMFLADVAMGNAYVPSGYHEDLPKKGYDSSYAKSRQSGVQNNEMIVYKTNQANLKYLVEFE